MCSSFSCLFFLWTCALLMPKTSFCDNTTYFQKICFNRNDDDGIREVNSSGARDLTIEFISVFNTCPQYRHEDTHEIETMAGSITHTYLIFNGRRQLERTGVLEEQNGTVYLRHVVDLEFAETPFFEYNVTSLRFLCEKLDFLKDYHTNRSKDPKASGRVLLIAIVEGHSDSCHTEDEKRCRNNAWSWFEGLDRTELFVVRDKPNPNDLFNTTEFAKVITLSGVLPLHDTCEIYYSKEKCVKSGSFQTIAVHFFKAVEEWASRLDRCVNRQVANCTQNESVVGCEWGLSKGEYQCVGFPESVPVGRILPGYESLMRTFCAERKPPRKRCNETQCAESKPTFKTTGTTSMQTILDTSAKEWKSSFITSSSETPTISTFTNTSTSPIPKDDLQSSKQTTRQTPVITTQIDQELNETSTETEKTTIPRTTSTPKTSAGRISIRTTTTASEEAFKPWVAVVMILGTLVITVGISLLIVWRMKKPRKKTNDEAPAQEPSRKKFSDKSMSVDHHETKETLVDIHDTEEKLVKKAQKSDPMDTSSVENSKDVKGGADCKDETPDNSKKKNDTLDTSEADNTQNSDKTLETAMVKMGIAEANTTQQSDQTASTTSGWTESISVTASKSVIY